MAIQPKATDDPDAAPVEDRIRALRARIDPMMGADVNPDASDATLSAIEEALNLSPQPGKADTSRMPKIDDTQDLARRLNADEPLRRRIEPDSAPISPSSKPANDDRRSVGQILQTLQYRPKRTGYVIAAVISAVWLGMVGVYALGARGTGMGQAGIALLALAAFGPVAFFFIVASLSQRLQEMRHTARSMSEVAIRLADPGSFSTEQVMVLSQAIRREIASMGDGVERALARAGELELMVHTEVSNLERSYADNERRMRSLIDELASEREAIVTNADRVRQSVSNAQETISREVAEAGSRITEHVNDAGAQINTLLEGQAEEIARQLRLTGTELIRTLSDQGDSYLSKLTDTGEALTMRLLDSTNQFTSTMAERAEAVEMQLQACSRMLSERIDTAALRVAETISDRSDTLVKRFDEASERVHNAIIVNGGDLSNTLVAC